MSCRAYLQVCDPGLTLSLTVYTALDTRTGTDFIHFVLGRVFAGQAKIRT